MPILRIMSIYKEHSGRFAAELSQTRTELEQFRASFIARFGRETAAAIGQQARGVEGVVIGGMEVPNSSRVSIVAARTMQTLDHKVMAVLKKIRTPDCWFRESPGVVSVLGMMGLSWRNVHDKCTENGWLSISGALWLLKGLHATEPTTEQAEVWTTMGGESIRVPEKWRRRLDRRRRRLTILLQTAVKLEEDVRWKYRL
ncbi:MAG: hypothetical protein ACLP9L_06770 [Thermoguttaceae bacterium]